MEDLTLLFHRRFNSIRTNIVSIILPVYNEEDSLTFVIEELFEYLSVNQAKYRFEITFVDDRSTDNSVNLIKQLAIKAPNNCKISIIKLAKNGGSHIAITAGLNVARGEFIILMASDGQDPASIIGKLILEWENGADIAIASRFTNLDHNKIGNLLSKTAIKIMKWATKIEMPKSGCDLLGMDKKVLIAFNRMDERNTTFIFRIFSLGFNRSEIQYVKRLRFAGKSKWSLWNKISVMLDAITGYSSRPLQLINKIGFFIIVILFFRWLYVIIQIYYFHKMPSDLIIILNTIFTSLGVIILIIGTLSEYIWRILEEARKRPLYHIQEVDGEIFNN